MAQMDSYVAKRDGTRTKHAGVPLRRVRAGEVRWEEFLYELKAGPAGGLRPPSGPAATRRSPENRPTLKFRSASAPWLGFLGKLLGCCGEPSDLDQLQAQ
jgi:hypothetical protein